MELRGVAEEQAAALRAHAEADYRSPQAELRALIDAAVAAHPGSSAHEITAKHKKLQKEGLAGGGRRLSPRRDGVIEEADAEPEVRPLAGKLNLAGRANSGCWPNGRNGRRARLQEPPREGPKSAPLAPAWEDHRRPRDRFRHEGLGAAACAGVRELVEADQRQR
jgi:hypothetical protein